MNSDKIPLGLKCFGVYIYTIYLILHNILPCFRFQPYESRYVVSFLIYVIFSPVGLVYKKAFSEGECWDR